MAENEKVLEELYELLDIYFSVNLPGGIFEKTFSSSKDVRPQLDHVILKEKILAKITSLIIENYIF